MAGRSSKDRERELLDRWRSIEDELDGDDDPSPSVQRRLLSAKEAWFSDSFDFLTKAPKETHIWCGYPDIMGPLLETFHGYFSDKDNKTSPLRILWKRISNELGSCTQCVCQYHQAQDAYTEDYQSDTVDPLLETLHRLDEERVTEHLKDINARIRVKKYDPICESGEVVSLMFEVLMYPTLLDDRSLANEFQIFIEAIDDAYEVNLSSDQQYAGVYALLFLNGCKARAIGLRLSRCMGKLKEASDLEPLQPLLKKWIGFLETEVLPSTSNSPRPRVQLKRSDVWLGIKSLLGFLEGSAFEDGILEKYPVFLNIILNHVSDDTSDFSYAVSCLKACFEMLGSKLWLRATLSPSVMRNTLLGHCFHTKDEKSHKDIFDLFIPFLQSLEALQDGEHEKQRRNILYFLLHQVTRSSNFSPFMHNNACKIALLIVHRGYTMDPPSPPSDCAHMWGPSLVNSLKDASLHIAFRQPAFDLINSIIISDACALISKHISVSEEEDEIPFSKSLEGENSEKTCWDEFKLQWKRTSRECNNWRCIPLLWYHAMLQVDPLNLPISFSKAVFWTLSRISVTGYGFNIDMSKSADEWVMSSLGDVLKCFKWETPSGSNDGEEGKESKNAVEVASSNWSLLTQAFKRFSIHHVVQIQKRELQKQWNWEPQMAESLILLLIDPNDSIRQADRAILEHVSKNRILTAGLQFLCSTESSLSFMYLGLKYAFKLVQVDPIEGNFQNLHHIFFVIKKLLKEVIAPTQSPIGMPIGASPPVKSLTGDGGGFLKQPGFSNPLTRQAVNSSSIVDMDSWKKFSYFLSVICWPFVLKCLEKGDFIMDLKPCEMTSVRLLEMLPSLLDRLGTGFSDTTLGKPLINIENLNWVFFLAKLGKSPQIVVFRHWKHCLDTVFHILREFKIDVRRILSLEAIASQDPINMEKLIEEASNLRSAPFQEPSIKPNEQTPFLKPPLFKSSSSNGITIPTTRGKNVIILSDDEDEVEDEEEEIETPVQAGPSDSVPVRREKETLKEFPSNQFLRKEIESRARPKPVLLEEIKQPTKPSNITIEPPKKTILQDTEPMKIPSSSKPSEREESLLKQIVQDNEPDPLDIALDRASRPPLPLTKALALPQIKRQVVQLPMPGGNKNNNNNNNFYRNRKIGVRSLQKPKLDHWFKDILQMDYFSIIGGKNDRNSNLKMVPEVFESQNHYVEIFKPLVLEEFKAQLKSTFLESSVEEMGKLSVVSVERIDDFLQIRARADENEIIGGRGGCMENDLVLLTRSPFKSPPESEHFFGNVKSREKDKNHQIVLIIRFLISTYTRAKLTERSKWHLNRVFNLTTQVREFSALSSMNNIPILPTILKPDRKIGSNSARNKIQLDQLKGPLRESLCSSFNESQLEAISVAIGKPRDDQDVELSLIQGPPGTGKTRTIVAIVSALLASPLVQRNYSSTSSSSNPYNSNWSTQSNSRNLSQTSSVTKAWQDLTLAKQLAKESKLQQEPSFSEIAERPLKGRVLICAQSNAAVDELVYRLSEGFLGNDGNLYKPFIVRVGNQRTIHPNSLRYFIDKLVEQKVSEDLKLKDIERKEMDFESSSSLRAKLEKVVDHIRYYESRRAKLDSNVPETVAETETVPNSNKIEQDNIPDDAIVGKLNVLYTQKRKINSDLNIAHERERKMAEENRSMKTRIRNQILRDAQIVLTTLSGSGGDLYDVCSASTNGKFGNFSENCLFDVVVIDEAAQALEPATLIPLQLLKSKGTKCIMVGDPKQLPATVISNVASKYLYECSMFERLQKAGHPVIMLTKQYRMHPEISRFPSLHFYENKLLNGANASEKTASFHETKLLGPYMFFDVMDGEERKRRSGGSQSLSNDFEIEAAIDILNFLKSRYESEFKCKKIGIITPYRSQLSQLRYKFDQTFGSESVSDYMELNTVDGFQGREVDILILSTVRASFSSDKPVPTGGGIGFVADVRRMNVALTRAKFSLWILGNARTLRINPHWNDLIDDAKERNLFVSIRRPYSSIFTRAMPNSRMKIFGQTNNPKPDRKSNDNPSKSRPTSGDINMRELVKLRPIGGDINMSREMPNSKMKVFGNTSNPRPAMKVFGNMSNTRPTGGDINMRELVTKAKETQNPNKPSNILNRGVGSSKPVQNDSSAQRRLVEKPKSSSNSGQVGSSSNLASQNKNKGKSESEDRNKGKMENDNSKKGGDQNLLNSARKRRREAVESLLSSALISNKKNKKP